MTRTIDQLTTDERSQLCAIFFTKDDDYATNFTYICNKCEAKRIRKVGSGLTNLIDHICRAHRDWQNAFDAHLNGSVGSVAQFLRKEASAAAKNIFRWIEWIVATDQSFRFIENKYVKKNTNLESISRMTLQKYMEQLLVIVKDKIKNMLVDKFGIIFDG